MRLLPLLAASAVLAMAAPAVAAAPAAATPVGRVHAPAWQMITTGSAQQFRGLAAVSDDVAWLAGTSGTVLRTTDGGRHWADVSPPGASALQFRDIEAFDARHAVALTIGNGTDSRIYVTADGGASWAQTFENADPNAFYDCLAFFDPRDGLAVSDPVDGRFRLIATHDGGQSWTLVDPAGMPAALPGEAGFAASGTCLITNGRHDAWIASGGASASRVYHSADGGRHWSVVSTPLVAGPTAGTYSLAVRSHGDLLAVGGDFMAPTANVDVAGYSRDAGRRWTVAAVQPGGYRSGVAWVSSREAVAVGPTGSDVTFDGGRTWRTFDTGYFDTVQTAPDGAVWASGKDGRVATLRR